MTATLIWNSTAVLYDLLCVNISSITTVKNLRGGESFPCQKNRTEKRDPMY